MESQPECAPTHAIESKNRGGSLHRAIEAVILMLFLAGCSDTAASASAAPVQKSDRLPGCQPIELTILNTTPTRFDGRKMDTMLPNGTPGKARCVLNTAKENVYLLERDEFPGSFALGIRYVKSPDEWANISDFHPVLKPGDSIDFKYDAGGKLIIFKLAYCTDGSRKLCSTLQDFTLTGSRFPQRQPPHSDKQKLMAVRRVIKGQAIYPAPQLSPRRRV